MRYFWIALGSLLLAATVRFITGNRAAVCTLLAVPLVSARLTEQAWVLPLLAFFDWAGVRLLPSYSLQVLTAVPCAGLLLLFIAGANTAPVVGLFVVEAITLIALGYRGWAKKRLLD